MGLKHCYKTEVFLHLFRYTLNWIVKIWGAGLHITSTRNSSGDEIANVNLLSAGLTIVAIVPWEGSVVTAARGLHQLTMFWRLNVEKTLTNQKCRVGLHVTFGLKDSRILFQYPSWSAIELLTAGWVKLLNTGICFLFWHTIPAGLHDLHDKRKRKN